MKKAVLVGINYYSVPGARLNGCINDITNISNVITNYYNYKPENITKLCDDTTNPLFMPTRRNILSNLTRLISESASCSEIWFHYSGHGSQIRDKNGDESDRLDEVIVPVDFRSSGFIIDDEIYQIIKLSKCRTVLVFDSCHSATICDLQWLFEYVSNNQFRKSVLSNRIIPNPNMICYSGCKDAQTAADTYSTVLNQGVGAFTDAMIHCLEESKMNISALYLHKNICQYIKAQGYTQIPMFSSSNPNPYYKFTPEVKTTPNVIQTPPVSAPVKTKNMFSMKDIMPREITTKDIIYLRPMVQFKMWL